MEKECPECGCLLDISDLENNEQIQCWNCGTELEFVDSDLVEV